MTVENTISVEEFRTSRPNNIDIGDGLLMRWSTIKDGENIANCMAKAFKWSGISAPVAEDEDPAPNEWVYAGVSRLMRGNSAVMTEHDYAVVENTLAKDGQNPIIACICLHGVPGFYGDKVSMLYGKPEAIIPGIPHFYRQFGYEYAIGLRSSRNIDDVSSIIPAKPAVTDDSTPEPFSLRAPCLDDIPYLCKMSTRERQKSQAQVGLEYRESYWRYTIHDVVETQASKFDVSRQTYVIVDSKTGKDCGIIMGGVMPRLGLYIFTLEDGYHYRDALYPVLRQFIERGSGPSPWELKQAAEMKDKDEAKENVAKEEKKEEEDVKKDTDKPAPPPSPMRLILDPSHPVTKLLECKSTLDSHKNVRLYTRIPSYAKFILKVAPTLEHRLAKSPLAGISVKLQFDFFRKVIGSAGRGLEVVIKDGKIISASDDFIPPTPEQLMLAARERIALAKAEGRSDNKKPLIFTASFAPLTLTRLLVGDLSIDEMIYFYSGCEISGGDDAKMMLDVLFPKQDEQFQVDMFWW
ncbi:hypothetical protein BGX33_005833 [Mortierella sp. NVP41]|nr:hypothetical protein BGX33_005833 [Mortierella sp. NVP41]